MKNESAEEILNRAYVYILAKHTVLASALNTAKFQESIFTSSYAFDGKCFYYSQDYILKKYEENKLFPACAVIHSLIHYIFMHPFILPSLSDFDFDKWTAACDITVDKIIMEIEPQLYSPEILKRKSKLLEAMSKKYKTFNVMSVYKYLLDEDGLDMKEIKELFCMDDHNLWYAKNKNDGEKGQNSDESNKNGNNKGNSESTLDMGMEKENKSENASDSTLKNSNESDEAKEWKEIAQTVKVMEESFGNKTKGGVLSENIDFGTEKRYNYRDFLKKFLSLREEIKVNPDEFDYIYYKLGMELYENIPLIEPLEYREESSINNFVIAIDTSGSTLGSLVEKFLRSTYDIVKLSGFFKKNFTLHIIQCDCKIQEHAVIKSQEEFDKYINSFKIKGMGGTDFRAVFEYIEKLKLKKLKGLIYFTDGNGTYPTKRPEYKTAFVFMKEDYREKNFPKWALKTVFDI